jgi:hypothetical protein
MEYQQKRALVEMNKKLTFAGVPCEVGGWANDYATITANFPGFWMASWETVERVVNGSGNFEPQDVQLISFRWKGDGTGFPDVVRKAFDIPYT